MDKKAAFLAFLGYVIWGFQPLYWNMLGHMDSMFNLAFRTLFALLFTLGILAFTKRLKDWAAVFRDKQKMKFLGPAALFLLLDWGLFIYAVQSGHVLDTSLGYFIGPFVVFFISMIVFKEKPGKMVGIAMILTFLGVLFNIIYNVLEYGSFPMLSLALSCLFAIYGMLKKYAQVESIVSIAAETTMMTPLAILFLLFFRMDVMASRSAADLVLLVGAGVLTAAPMLLYSFGVLKLPYVMLGFMQYISPTLSMICGLLMGEAMTIDKLVTFLFIWAGLIVYATATLKAEKKKRESAQAAAEKI